MKKPITVEREEFLTNLKQLLRTCELPAFLKIDILQAFIPILEDEASKEYKRDLESWQSQMTQLTQLIDDPSSVVNSSDEVNLEGDE